MELVKEEHLAGYFWCQVGYGVLVSPNRMHSSEKNCKKSKQIHVHLTTNHGMA